MGAHKLSIAEAEPTDNAKQDYLSMEFKKGEVPLFNILPPLLWPRCTKGKTFCMTKGITFSKTFAFV